MFHSIVPLEISPAGLRLPTAKDSGAWFNRLPERCFMTALALWAETSVMLVILFVATDTGGRCFDLLVHALGVTGITIEPFVSAIEFEAGACVVIEVPEFPVS